jgi:hypothetical protein
MRVPPVLRNWDLGGKPAVFLHQDRGKSASAANEVKSGHLLKSLQHSQNKREEVFWQIISLKYFEE